MNAIVESIRSSNIHSCRGAN